jgi:hypothetical protein
MKSPIIHRPSTIIHLLAAQCVAVFGCSHAAAIPLVKRALLDDTVRAALFERVGEYLVDAAFETITDTNWTEDTGGRS